MATASHNQKLNVLIVDDSAVYRKILKEVVGDLDSGQVMATAPNGRIALEKIKLNPPDVVLLDVEMPEMDGLQTLEAIRQLAPKIAVIMVSGIGKRSADVTVAALEMGAVDFVTKPDEASQSFNHKCLVDRLNPIFMNVETKLAVEKVRRRHELIAERLSKSPAAPVVASEDAVGPARSPQSARKLPARIDVVVIGISTGGPNALGTMIPRLPPDLGVPILVVQHMPPVFTASLASSLNGKARLPVTEGRGDELIEPNHIYIAPGDFTWWCDGEKRTVVRPSDSMRIRRKTAAGRLWMCCFVRWRRSLAAACCR